MSAPSLSSVSDKFGGRLPVRVHFLDNSSKMFLLDSTITAGELIKKILDKFVVKTIDDVALNFALFESKNGSAINGYLYSDDIVVDVVNAWKGSSEAKLVFMIRLFVPSIWGIEPRDDVARRIGVGESESENVGDDLPLSAYLESAKVVDAGLLRLQYLQALYHVITGLLVFTESKALHLGAIHFLLKFSSFQSNRHVPTFLGNRIVEFIPARLLKKSSSTLENWEIALLDASRKLATSMNLIDLESDEGEDSQGEGSSGKGDVYDDTSIQLYHMYMKEVYANEHYGSTFFRIDQKATRYAPESPVVAVHSSGISICDRSRAVQKRFHIEEVPAWGFKPATHFAFEVVNKENVGGAANKASDTSMEFVTTDCKILAHLLTDYSISYQKEKEGRHKRSIAYSKTGIKRPQRGNSTKASSASPVAVKIPKTVENELAALTLQRIYRGYALRRDWITFDAATLIQCVIRGYIARKKVAAVIDNMLKTGDAHVDD